MSGYVLVCRNEESKDDSVELPTEEDGTLLLSVLQSQFEGASGIRYRNPSTGTWRAVKISEGILKPPSTDGWGDTTYFVVMGTSSIKAETTESNVGRNYYGSPAPSVGYSSDGSKRIKLEEPPSTTVSQTPVDYYSRPPPSLPQSSDDVIVLGLEWTVTTEDMRQYFEKFGEIVSAEVKTDPGTGRSRGFGFIRFSDPEVRRKVFELNHAIKGRKVDVREPKVNAPHPTKLFVGCLPLKPEVERDELESHFSEFGKLTDVYVPQPYRGFGFITYNDPSVAQRVLNIQHTLRKSQLNLTLADPKGTASAKSAHAQYQPHYHQPDYNAYQQQYNYGQYAQYNQTPGAYSGTPQTSSGYGYNAYVAANSQHARANYDQGYVDGQTHAQHSPSQYTHAQTQVHRSVPYQNPPANPSYTHPQYQAQSYGQHDPQQQQQQQQPSPPKQQYPGQPSADKQPPYEYPRAYDPKSVWKNY